MGLMNEYIERKLSPSDYEQELLSLIGKYNQLRNTNLFVYSVAISKKFPQNALDQDDYYIFHDLLSEYRRSDKKKLEIYIESPGGSGEAAEEIVRFLRECFDTVHFIVSGEAKSAATLVVLSGDEIHMTETGSLGPIDAQITIGRSIQSAFDYLEWVQDKRKEAEKKNALNLVDTTMIAQITPGELAGVVNSLDFAKDLVIEWLSSYKFKRWTVTEHAQTVVTDAIRKKRAEDIAQDLCNHGKWRSHGRSLKIEDLAAIGLKINRIEDSPDMADIVFRIQTVCRLLFVSTTAFKIFATENMKIIKSANPPIRLPQPPDVAQFEITCKKCGKQLKLYAKFVANPQIDTDMQRQGFGPFPKDACIVCACGTNIDLTELKKGTEAQTGRCFI